MSSDWNLVGNIANVQSLAAVALTGAAAMYLRTLPDNICAQLDLYSSRLRDIEDMINMLSDEERQWLHEASLRRECTSLDQLKNELKK